MKTIPLDLVVSDAWTALDAQLADAASSIVLLTFKSRLGGDLVEPVRHARLDLDKRWLIDEAPAEIRRDTVDEIVHLVADARRAAG